MRTYWESNEEYEFNREAFRQYVDPLLGRTKDGKKTRNALFEEWASVLGVSPDSLKHWYTDSPNKRNDPMTLQNIIDLGNVLNIDYRLLLKFKKDGEKNDMSMAKILEQNERIESKIDSIIEILKRAQPGGTREGSQNER